MKLKLEIYGSLCETSVFEINGISADHRDFGYKGDNNMEAAEDYCCGNMVFEPKDATKEILEKYSIIPDEYDTVAEKLKSGLSFGSCGWCS
jgi:hypothetical protein